MLDANANRAAEGLRTLEDIARFVLDDETVCRAFKQSRHELTTLLNQKNWQVRLASRDTAHDVGTDVTTASEQSRPSMVAIAAAAAGRIEQAFRCIEECLKLVAPQQASRIERLRYQAYDLHAKLLLRLDRDVANLKAARLYVLVSCDVEESHFVDRVASIAESGADLIQIRDKSADAIRIQRYFELANAAVDRRRCRLIINDRVDLAVACQADAVHLGQTDLSPSQARAMLPTAAWIGLSTHNADQLARVDVEVVDYIGCGPTFPSQTKRFDDFAGLDYLRHVAAHSSVPAFAIGGITLENIDQVMATGIARVAVANAIWNAKDIRVTVKRFVDHLPSN